MNRKKSFENDKATLYLVATPIGNLSEMTPRAIEVLKSVDVIAAEDTRNTMKLLSHFDIKTRCMAHHMHNEYESARGLLALLVEAGFNVVPISGANAALNALVASGLSAQPFMFVGFLKANENERRKSCEELAKVKQTLIFYEAPHRIKKTLHTFLEVFGNRKMCLAREITKKHEEFLRGTISEILDICDDLKGEMVLVLEGYKEDEISDDIPFSVLYEKIHCYIQSGYSTNEAIKKVAKDHGLSKNEVYKQYHSS